MDIRIRGACMHASRIRISIYANNSRVRVYTYVYTYIIRRRSASVTRDLWPPRGTRLHQYVLITNTSHAFQPLP